MLIKEIICLLFPKVNYNQQKHIINTYPTPFLKIKKKNIYKYM